jgi:hypothetical protein
MQRWKQYGGLAALFAGCLGAGLWGFTSTGGALPWAKRSARALQRGAREGGGALVDLGRGVVVAGPIRRGGLLFEYGALVLVLAAVGVGLYVYADRYGDAGDGERSAR